jgi:diacylglycerol kinase (ATP)
MADSQRAFVLFNPAAGRGRERIDGYLSLLQRHLQSFDHILTGHAGHEIDLVDEALESGYKSIVAVGGDGTWSVVADRIIRSGRTDVTLGLLPAGTGNDFGKSLGITYDRRDAVLQGIASGQRRTIDVGRVEQRHFLNIVGFGFDIAVIDDAVGIPILKGDLLYQFCALRQLFRFRGIPIALSDGSSSPVRDTLLMLIIANANYFGGSFHIAPEASLEDGKLDAVSISNAGPLNRAKLFARVSKGTHQGDPKVSLRQAPRFTAEFDGPVRFEADGEVYTSAGNTVTVESVPAALSIFVPAP